MPGSNAGTVVTGQSGLQLETDIAPDNSSRVILGGAVLYGPDGIAVGTSGATWAGIPTVAVGTAPVVLAQGNITVPSETLIAVSASIPAPDGTYLRLAVVYNSSVANAELTSLAAVATSAHFGEYTGPVVTATEGVPTGDNGTVTLSDPFFFGAITLQFAYTAATESAGAIDWCLLAY